MKRKLYMIIVMLISLFFINIDKINAYKCVYGEKIEKKAEDGTVTGIWNEKLSIEVNGYDDYTILSDESPMLTEKGGSFSTLSKKTEDGLEYFYAEEDIGIAVSKRNIKIYLSLYPTNDLYTASNGTCPAHLNVKSGTDTRFSNLTHVYAIYNDDLDSEENSKHAAWYKKVIEKIKVTSDQKEDHYVEESHKDEKLEDIVDKYGCITYSSYLNLLKEAKTKFGTCDNNAEFTDKYNRLYSLCESFRSTANYADEDDDGITAKSCMRACSNLKDDVADICNRESSDIQCGSLGQKIVKWIYKIIRMVRYIIPILIILLSILDYIKAIGSDSDDEMKKATGKFFKRLIVAAIIFIIPFILEFVLKMFHLPGLSDTNPFCSNPSK